MAKFYLKLNMCMAILLLLGSSAAFAQGKTVTGKVTSADDNSPIPGVNILEKGTTNGTVTDSNGAYSISVKEDATLVFSFIGYTAQEVPVSGRTTADVNLATDITTLSEIVVVGYGEVQKKDLTGAVVAISSKDFNKGIMTSPQDLMVGKLAGVQVTSSTGAPGAGATIRVRGGSSLNASNDPLIIIDGFPVDNASISGVSNPLAALNPNDIETFTVLKDASATAIYGSRASNGVILITTKKGKEGKPQIAYNGTVSVSSPIKYMDVLSADEYRALAAKLAEDGTGGINNLALAKLGTANTDWQKEIYRNAISHNHNLSLAGGFRNIPYRLSYGYTNQQGILKTTDLDRNSLNININPSLLKDHLKINASAKGSYSKINFGNDGAVGSAINFDPTQPVRSGNSDFGGYTTWLTNDGLPNLIATDNPVALLNQTDNRSIAKRIIANLQAEYKFPFLPELKFNVNTGFDLTKSDGHDNAPSDAAFTYRGGIGRKKDYGAKNHSELLDAYLSYVKDIGSHRIDLTGGYSWQHFRRQDFELNTNEAGTVINNNIVHKNENYLVSFFGRLNYSFKDKYLLTATLRDDGSSRFAKSNRWGLFPAVSLAWRISEEAFMGSIPAISNLKLRAGYGVTGQQDVSSNYYPYLATYNIGQDNAQYQFGSAFYKTFRPNAYDANIKWESTTTYNAGLDFGFANDRITGSVEVYERKTTDLLNYIPIPLGSNFSNFLDTNVGSLTNKGVEVTLSAMPISKADVTWNAGVNFTYNVNKITHLTLNDDPGYTGVNSKFIAGGVGNYVGNYNINYPSTSYFVFQQVYDSNGKPVEGLYVDRSGKGGNVTSSDLNRRHYKQSAPKVMMGVNSRVTYHKFDFSFSGRFSFGNYVYNNNLSSRAFYNNMYNQSGYFSNVPTAINDTKFVNQQYTSDYYIQDASFFKMDNMSAGYNLDQVFTSKVKARISLTVQNAFIVTKYNGIDPEVDGGKNPGVDNNIYPRPRTFLLGLNLTF
jgi:TonB-dependent starch-binding outer membrane protein SusC